jgi:hypothetical protein
LYFLEPVKVQALISNAVSFFGETSVVAVNGDIDQSGAIDILDLAILVDFLFLNQAISNPNGADVDGSCEIDLSDLGMFANLLFGGTVEISPGCVE